MIVILAFALLLLSIVSTVILRNASLSLFLLLMASNHSSEEIFIIPALGATLLLQLFLIDNSEKNKIFWFIAIFYAVYHAAIFVIQPYEINYSYFLSYINAGLMFALTLSLDWNKEKLARFILAYISLLLIWGFLEFIFISPLRIEGPLHFATLYAVVLVTVWVIWITVAVLDNGITKKIIIMTIFVFVAVLLSGSRMGLLGIALGLFFSGISKILVMNFKRSIFVKIVSGAVFLACLSILIVIIWQMVPEDLLIKKAFQSILSMKLDKSNLGRVISWITAIDVIPKHAFWGLGPGNFDAQAQLFMRKNGIPPFLLPHAHNLFLIVLSELGISGFILIGSIAFLCEFKLFGYLLKGTQNSAVYAILNGFGVMVFMGMFDATPFTIGTLGFGGWLMGISFYFSFLEGRK
jgi:O-antigen ligase